ncbi:MAG TPA: N,N-dimethylformamidase beta subunit family domain-containing protein, partial [Chloroflexota bacterium]
MPRLRLCAPRRVHAVVSLLVVLGMLLSALPGGSIPIVEAAPCDPPITQPIVCENSKVGNPSSEWDVGLVDGSALRGFSTDISVAPGGTIRFKITTSANAYRIDVYRIGYYAGLGARKIGTVPNSATTKRNQPACLTDAPTGLIDCGNWSETASWAVPANAVSGLYLAKLVREDAIAGASHIPFVVRDGRPAPVLFQTSDTTWQAYNNYGGNSLYVNQAGNLPAGRAYKVSYNRPFVTREGFGQKDYLFTSEYPMIRFLEANGYDVTYQSGIDTDRLGAATLTTHQAFLSVGHDEYWSKGQRTNVEAARDAGVDLAFFSGNEVYWKTRYENSIDGSGTAYRTLVCYKETQANAKVDPSPEWTGTWRDPRFSPPADGGRPENALSGTLFTVQATSGAITVPEPDGKLRFWRNTDLATLSPGQTASVGTNTVGFEWDEDVDNGSRPAGLFRLSEGTFSVPEKLLDYGSTVGPGTATHSMTLYRAASGALVFGAGTIQYAWGLDDAHDGGPGGATSDARLRQATVNLLADMGVQ